MPYREIESTTLNDEVRASVAGDYVQLTHGLNRYQIVGPEDGKPIILIPGATLPLIVWEPLMQSLGDAGYRAVCFDLYGRGYSDRPALDYTQALFTQQIFELADALSLKGKLNIVALAFGAVIALGLVNQYPHRVQSLSLIAPDGLGVKMSLAQRLIYIKGLGELIFRRSGDKTLLSRLPGYSQDESFVEFLRQHFEPTFRIKGFRHGLLSSLRHIPVHRANLIYKQASVSNAPMQIIWGESDQITPFTSAPLMRRLLPNAEFNALPNVGHLPQYDAPEKTKHLLTDFLARVS